MKAVGYVRMSEDGDAKELGPRLRGIDIDEIESMSGHRAGTLALELAHLSKDPSYTIVLADGLIIGMFGVATVSHGMGMVWLLAAPELEAGAPSREFLRQSRFWVNLMAKRCPVMFNIIDARNEVSINWLKWCGFKFPYPAVPFGHKKRPSLYFERVPTHV